MDPPSVYVLSECIPPQPVGLEPRHVDLEIWMEERKCREDLVVDAAQIAAVSKPAESHPDVVRRSLRAEPAVVDVKWSGLQAVLADVSQKLWPGEDRELRARLQAVLVYEEKGRFDRHVDRCEETGQEGVLIVDLGLRSGMYNDYDPERPELFLHGLAPEGAGGLTKTEDAPPPLVANWSASGPGSWVAFPMHRAHGVYPLFTRRVVAVYTLIDPTLPYVGVCTCYYGSCNLESCQPLYGGGCYVERCRPGEICMTT